MAPTIWSQHMLTVADVEASSALYCSIFGFVSAHGGNEYDQLTHDGELIMQLHDFDTDDHHGPIRSKDHPAGNGVIVWFEVSDFDGCVQRARDAGVEIYNDVHINPNAKQPELWFRDPDGYLVVIAGESDYRPRG